jgi:hypothetical protein
LIQRTIVPSAIDSPICGITTGVDIDTYALKDVSPRRARRATPRPPPPTSSGARESS